MTVPWYQLAEADMPSRFFYIIPFFLPERRRSALGLISKILPSIDGVRLTTAGSLQPHRYSVQALLSLARSAKGR